MRGFRFMASRRLALVAVLLLPLGCGVKCYPVRGTVTIDGKPVRGKAGAVVFKPDAAQGNASPLAALGSLDTEGSYTLATQGKPGAPPGKYKVVVTVNQPGVPNITGDEQALIRSDYQLEKKTPLTAEVVPDPKPGAYDLNLKRK